MRHDALQIAQDRETPVRVERYAAFSWRYAYARAAETRKFGAPGEDYLTFRYSDGTFVFSLCDGVSQSFFGGLAAHFLGDGLIEWLWQGLPNGSDEEQVRTTFTGHLKTLATQSRSLVADHPLPHDIPEMVRDVLEEKRAMGSETTFVCGRIDLPSEDYPDGRIFLSWMGDSRLRLWGPGGERTAELGETFMTEQRWSTRRGPVKGEPHLLLTPVLRDGQPQIVQLMAYSDGLSVMDGYAEAPSSKELNKLISAAAHTAVSDDISFLEIWLEQGLPQGKNGAGATVGLPTVQKQNEPPAYSTDGTNADGPKSQVEFAAGMQKQEPPVLNKSDTAVAVVAALANTTRPKRNNYLLIAAVAVIIVLGVLAAWGLLKV